MMAAELPLFRVPKVCACGATWIGNSLIAHKPGDQAVTAKCDACVKKHQALVARAQTNRLRIALEHPPTAEEDQPYSSRRGRR